MPELLEWWIMLSSAYITKQLIKSCALVTLIHWIAIYREDSVLKLSGLRTLGLDLSLLIFIYIPENFAAH